MNIPATAPCIASKIPQENKENIYPKQREAKKVRFSPEVAHRQTFAADVLVEQVIPLKSLRNRKDEKQLTGRIPSGITRASPAWSAPDMDWLYNAARLTLAKEVTPETKKEFKTQMAKIAEQDWQESENVNREDLEVIYYSLAGKKLHSKKATASNPALKLAMLKKRYPMTEEQLQETLLAKLKNIECIDCSEKGAYDLTYCKVSKKEIYSYLDHILCKQSIFN